MMFGAFHVVELMYVGHFQVFVTKIIQLCVASLEKYRQRSVVLIDLETRAVPEQMKEEMYHSLADGVELSVVNFQSRDFVGVDVEALFSSLVRALRNV